MVNVGGGSRHPPRLSGRGPVLEGGARLREWVKRPPKWRINRCWYVLSVVGGPLR